MNKPDPVVGMHVQGPKGRENILLMIGGDTYTVNRLQCPKFNEVIEAFKNKEYELIPALVSAREALSTLLSSTGDTEVEFTDEHIIVNGNQLAPVMENLLLSIYESGAPMQPYIELVERLDNAANSTIRDYLFGWMRTAELPVTEDGMLLAFRSCKVYRGPDKTSENGYTVKAGDYVDAHSGDYRNNVGDISTMKRSEVNDDRHNACAPGLHFASYEHASGFGGNDRAVMVVEIDPADVVMIPATEQDKGRCCKFKVVSIARHPNSTAPVSATIVLGDAPVTTVEAVQAQAGRRWIVYRPDGTEQNRYPTRRKAIAAQKKLNEHQPGHKWRDAHK